MKLFSLLALMAALAAVFLVTNWGEDFNELDTASKIFTVIFQRVLPLVATSDKTFFPLSVERQVYAQHSRTFNHLETLFNSDLEDVELLEAFADNDGAKIPLRIYRKKEAGANKLRPVLLWIHGGGCILGEANLDDNTCKKYALLNDFLVVNVDYRLAPEHIFPTAVHDVHAALQWIRRHAREFGGDVSRVVISGESAGGYLTLAVAALHYSDEEKRKGSKLRIVALVPVYPSVDSSFVGRPMLSNITGILPVSHVDHMRYLYSGGRVRELSRNYLFAPLYTDDQVLRRFPPTITVVAKHDILATEGIQFAERLQSLGIPSDLLLYNASIHNFYGRWYFSEGDLAMQHVAEKLRPLLVKAPAV